MAEEISRWIKFKRFLKRNLTPTWAKHFSYQVFAFLVSVAMVIGVATYAVNKSYDERTLHLRDDFTITAKAGAFGQNELSTDWVKACVNNNVNVIEIAVRQRPDNILVMSNDILVTNNDGIPLSEVFEMIKPTEIKLNLNIKEMRTLNQLHDMLVEYGLLNRAFLTGIQSMNVSTVKASTCANIPYYLDYQPSRIKIFDDDYAEDLIKRIEESGAIGINCNFNSAGGKLSEVLHHSGYKMSVDGVNSEYPMKRILMAKPDNITTKNYDDVLFKINNWGK